jgi:hypothetical protein
MAALTAIVPTNLGTVNAGAAVSASDTIAQSVMGPKGCYLEIINGNASGDIVTISDSGLTPAGNPLATGTVTDTVATGTSQIFYISPQQVNPATNLVTVTHSVTATVTYKLYPNGV